MARQFSDLTPAGRKFFRELKKLQDLEVQVGFQGDQKYEDGTSIAEVAAYNEFGSSDTPERPIRRQSFENHEAELKAGCEAANRIVNSGGSAEQALQQLGAMAKGLVQDEIVNGDFAPNAESTIQKKGSEQPLIDTGTMRQSVNFVNMRSGG